MVRQLQPHLHLDESAAAVKELEGKVPNVKVFDIKEYAAQIETACVNCLREKTPAPAVPGLADETTAMTQEATAGAGGPVLG